MGMKLEEIEKLLSEATPGPWEYEYSEDSYIQYCPADARLIAAAPTVIRELVEQNKRLREALESVEWVSDDDGYYSCPGCCKFEKYGHAENCLIAAALKEST